MDDKVSQYNNIKENVTNFGGFKEILWEKIHNLSTTNSIKQKISQ